MTGHSLQTGFVRADTNTPQQANLDSNGNVQVAITGHVNTKTALTPGAPTAISVDTTSALAVATNAARTGLVLINLSSGLVSFGLGTAAVLSSGITLAPNGVWEMDEYTFTTGAIYAIAAGAASAVAVQEFS